MPVSTCLETLRLYLPYLRAQDPVGVLQPPQHAVYAQRVLPLAIKWIMRQSVPRSEADGLKWLPGVLQFLEEYLQWARPWLELDEPLVIQGLQAIMEPSAALCRTASANAAVERWVREQLEVEEAADVEQQGGGGWSDAKIRSGRVAWDHHSHHLVALLMAKWGSLDGWNAIHSRLSREPTTPLAWLEPMVKWLSKVKVVASSRLLQLLYVPLPTLVFERQLLSLNTDELRQVTKQQVSDVVTHMKTCLRAVHATSAQAEALCDAFGLQFALKCLQSPLQDKKFNGLHHVEEAIEMLTQERSLAFRPPVKVSDVTQVEEKTTQLVEWLRDHHVVEVVLQRDNLRRELILLSKKTVRFLVQQGELHERTLEHLLAAILANHHDKNKDVRDALYECVVESCDRLPLAMAQLVWSVLRSADPSKHLCAPSMRLAQRVVAGAAAAQDTALALEVTAFVWDVAQDSSRAPREAVEEALVVLPQVAEAAQVQLTDDCVRSLQRRRSGLQALRVLRHEVQHTTWSRREEVAQHLLVDCGVFALALEELSHYKRAAKAAAAAAVGGGGGDVNSRALVGLFPHLEAVSGRLTLIRELADEANQLPDHTYLPELWRTAVETHISQAECDQGLTWLCRLCLQDDSLTYGLFDRALLSASPESRRIFTASESAFDALLSLFFAVNHDRELVQCRDRLEASTFQESRQWPPLGLTPLMQCLVWDASSDLWQRGCDILINLHLQVSPPTAADSFRQGLASEVLDMLEQRPRDARGVDRLVALLKNMVALTKTKEEEEDKKKKKKKQKEDDDAAAAAAATGGGEVEDAEEAAKKEFTVFQSDRDKINSFMEMFGASFPPEYAYVMSAVLLKQATWQVERAINDYLMDMDSKLDYALAEAKTYRRYDPLTAAGAQQQEAAQEAKVEVVGQSMAQVLGASPRAYDVLFALLEEDGVERDAVWALLKQLPPDARLTSELEEEAIDWNRVLGHKASFHLLYSLELVRQSIPSEDDESDEHDRKTRWCRTFVHRGGFAFLFELLKRIAGGAVDPNQGAIERSCLGHLLRLVYYFMRAELDDLGGEAALDDDAELRLSVSTTRAVVAGAPFEEMGSLMFDLMSRQGMSSSSSSSSSPSSDVQQDDEVLRFAVLLWGGSVLRAPSLVMTLFQQSSFDEQLLQLLCCSHETLRRELALQLIHLCGELRASTGPSSPLQLVVQLCLSYVPRVLSSPALWERCAPVFQVLTALLPAALEQALVEPSSWWAPSASSSSSSPRALLLLAIKGLVEERVPGLEHTAFGGGPDEALAGLFQLCENLVDSSLEVDANMLPSLCRLVLEDCLFAAPREDHRGCVVASTRRAGLSLCVRLCQQSTPAWQWTISFLGQHHRHQHPFSSWRPVEAAGGSATRRTQYVGLRNLGATCYMNATLQQLHMIPKLRTTVLSAPASSTEQPMLWELQRLQAALLHSESSWADTEPFVRTLRDGAGDKINYSRQEDAYDFLTRFQESLEGQLTDDRAKVFKELFSVEMLQEIECRNGHAKSTPQQPEPVLQVDFGANIEEALSTTFGLEGDPISDYHCDGCEAKVDIVKRHMIRSGSDMLVVMLRRFEWDYFATGGNTRKKLKGNFEIPLTLNLSPYTKDGVHQRRLGKPPVVHEELQYELRGIVVHSGRTMDSGHYYSIIRDAHDAHSWLKFDDRDVTPFAAEWLDEKHAKFIGECYMLIFQRGGVVKEEAAHVHEVVSPAILEEVKRANAQQVEERRFQELAYFDFVLEVLSAIPEACKDDTYREEWSRQGLPLKLSRLQKKQDKGKDEEPKQEEEHDDVFGALSKERVTLQTAQVAAVFVWETWMRSRERVGESRKDQLEQWAVLLRHVFLDNVPACAWMAHQLLSVRQRWLSYFLLECEESWVRPVFQQWLQLIVLTLGDVEAPLGLLRVTRFESYEAQLQSDARGLSGRLLDAVFELFETSRSHWRRFHEYWVLIRTVLHQSPALATHAAAGWYETYCDTPMPLLALYVDYFMGEYSPFAKKLRLERASLGNKMNGVQVDLREHLWSMHQALQAYAIHDEPCAPGVVPHALDLELWLRNDMLASLIKQEYNAEATALMCCHFQPDNLKVTRWFITLALDILYRDINFAQSIFFHMLTLSDSLQPLRVASLMGDDRRGFWMAMRERLTYNREVVLSYLRQLSEELARSPIIASYVYYSTPLWEPILHPFLSQFNDGQLIELTFATVDEHADRVNWEQELKAYDENEDEATQVDDEGGEDDDDVILYDENGHAPMDVD